jgi:threonyl-tRNA synthetase
MIKITLPDGSIKEFAPGLLYGCCQVSEGFARNVISASFDGTTVETTTPLTTDGSLILYTWNDEGGKKLWHSTSHVAQVLEDVSWNQTNTWTSNINGFIMMWILKIRKSLMLISKKIEDRVLEISREKHEFKLRPVSKAEL